MSRKKALDDERRLEILLRKRENERKRLAKIKSDPISAAQLKEKEHLKYLKKKEKGQIKSITELSIREQRKQRRLWRINQRRRRAKTKSNISSPDNKEMLDHPCSSSTIIKFEQEETLTSTEEQHVTNIDKFEQQHLLTSIKLEKPDYSTRSQILKQTETLAKNQCYIECQGDSQPVSSASIKSEETGYLNSTKTLEKPELIANAMLKQPRPSTSTKMKEQPQMSTMNRFFIRSKYELQTASSPTSNVFKKQHSSTFNNIFDQSQFPTCNKIIKPPQSSINANKVDEIQPLSNPNMFDQLQPFTKAKVSGQSQPSSSILPIKNSTIFAKPQQITKNRFYIRTKDEKL